MKRFTLCAFMASLGAFMASPSVGLAQQPAEKPRFEVASIKPSDPNPANPIWIGMTADPGIVRYTNITLKDCIRAAWLVRDFQIEGPDWITASRFEITAKLPPGAQSDQIPEMLKDLLAERFRLTLRRYTKEQSVYALTVGKDGPKLKKSEVKADSQGPTALGSDGKPRGSLMFRVLPSSVVLTAPSATLASLAGLISRFTERPVVDMTGIEGNYDFSLTFAPETLRSLQANGLVDRDNSPTPSDPGPSMFEAVQQYGLKLEARKAPIEMFTVTNAEKIPTEN